MNDSESMHHNMREERKKIKEQDDFSLMSCRFNAAALSGGNVDFDLDSN
jgi:hypothetical protein